DGTNNELNYGLIAQEVESVFPELSATLDNGYKGVRYDSYMMVFTIQALKELNEKVESYRYFDVDAEDNTTIFTNQNVRVNGELRIGGVSMFYDEANEELRVEGKLTINGILKAKEVVADIVRTKSILIDSSQGRIGRMIILAGEQEVFVEMDDISDDDYLIISTPDTDIGYTKEIIPGSGFRVRLKSLYTEDITFEYVIVREYHE
ncbi:MAG: hypothetical protein N3A71_03885, partial [Candidatus Dojkabacteria bacterium]|nr:hypothetical protein [Candidatus Dojkabacteria bacterium]